MVLSYVDYATTFMFKFYIMKNFMTLLLLISLCVAGNVHAQKLSKKFSFGFGLEGGPTTGVLNNTYGGIGGFTLRGSYHIGPGFATLTAGGFAMFPKTIAGASLDYGTLFPVKAGYKYIFLKHLFVMGEIGYSSITTSIYSPFLGRNISASTSGFTFAPAAGVQFGAMELGLRYESTMVTGGNYSFIAGRLGFNF